MYPHTQHPTNQLAWLSQVAWERASQHLQFFYKQTDFQLFLALVDWKGNILINSMTYSCSCHWAPVQFCKSQCESEPVWKANSGSEGRTAEIYRGSAVNKTFDIIDSKNRHIQAVEISEQNNPGKNNNNLFLSQMKVQKTAKYLSHIIWPFLSRNSHKCPNINP